MDILRDIWLVLTNVSHKATLTDPVWQGITCFVLVLSFSFSLSLSLSTLSTLSLSIYVDHFPLREGFMEGTSQDSKS